MQYSQSPPLAEDEAADESSPRKFARDQEPRPEPAFGRRPVSPSHYPRPPQSRPSIGRRMLRAVTRFTIAVLIGVGATLGWQAYGDMAKQMLAARAPELAWALAYVPTTPPVAVAAAAPANPSLQLEPVMTGLDIIRRSVEQLAVKQEQMARNIAALQAVDEEIRQKVSSPPPAQPAAAAPPPKPAPPRTQSATPPATQPAAAPAAPTPRPSGAPGPLSLAPAR